jgi:hypothetical protein
MTNTPLNSKALNSVFDASTTYIRGIDAAINECEANLAKLKGIRSQIKREFLGENLRNKSALSQAMNEAGPAITTDAEDAAAIKAVSDELINVR